MKTTKEERDRLRELVKQYVAGVPAFTTKVVSRLLDDADHAAELEAMVHGIQSTLFAAHDDLAGPDHSCGCRFCDEWRSP